ncbi:hypothetical protein NDU88_006867 [Pleurodeles waltl]|uniref:Uncharacterized protein n=1 Tax=Pleurodeles waltl TaxID=8319 RepID=A0AAV7QMD9_PLEWA|nr:hypothetical protein NDU88_006867 [Pleurodeles waltl]
MVRYGEELGDEQYLRGPYTRRGSPICRRSKQYRTGSTIDAGAGRACAVDPREEVSADSLPCASLPGLWLSLSPWRIGASWAIGLCAPCSVSQRREADRLDLRRPGGLGHADRRGCGRPLSPGAAARLLGRPLLGAVAGGVVLPYRGRPNRVSRRKSTGVPGPRPRALARGRPLPPP